MIPSIFLLAGCVLSQEQWLCFVVLLTNLGRQVSLLSNSFTCRITLPKTTCRCKLETVLM